MEELGRITVNIFVKTESNNRGKQVAVFRHYGTISECKNEAGKFICFNEKLPFAEIKFVNEQHFDASEFLN